jgi:ABC-type phosphate transport system substrate-binding protein
MASSLQRFALCLAIIALMSRAAPADQPHRFVLVRNAKNPTTHMSLETMKAVYSGRTTTWSNGDMLVVVIGPEDSPAMAWLADTVFNVSAKTLLIRIKQQVFRGEMPHPITAADDGAAIAAIAAQPNLVGLVSEAAAKALPSGVAVIASE